MSLTVRIHSTTHIALKGLSKATGKSMQDVLSLAIDEFRRKWMLAATAEALSELRKDPKAWNQLMAEQKVWEGTLADGLERE
ncbi:MAG: toxin-antitoxin system protein [Planctomycetota bacterium]